MRIFLLSRTLVSCALMMCLGCDEKPQVAPPDEKQPLASPQDKASVVEEKPWFVGTWSAAGSVSGGSDAVALDRAARTGEAEPQEGPSVPVELSVSIDEERRAMGKAKMGEEEVSLAGLLDDKALRLSMRGRTWQGILVAGRRDEDAFEGTLRASTTSLDKGKPMTHVAAGAFELTKVK